MLTCYIGRRHHTPSMVISLSDSSMYRDGSSRRRHHHLQNTPQSFRLLPNNHFHVQPHRRLSTLPLKLGHQFLGHFLGNNFLTHLSKSYHRHGHQRLQCPGKPGAGTISQMRSCSTIVFLDMEIAKADAFGLVLDVLCGLCVETGLLHGFEEKAACFNEAWWLGIHITCDGFHVDFFPLEVATGFCTLLLRISGSLTVSFTHTEDIEYILYCELVFDLSESANQ